MAPPPLKQKAEEAEDWLTTYADAITLLMAFFVMLLTFAEFDIPAYEELSSGIASAVGNNDPKTTTQTLKIDVQNIVYEMQADQVINIEVDDKGVVIELQSNAFFKPGKAELVDAAIPLLTKMATMLADTRYELYNIVVEGHTDDAPIRTAQFPSNWELSIGRASTVVRLFESNDVDRTRLAAAGYADIQPKVPNLDLSGKPIPENRATNRRVKLHLTPMSIAQRAEYLQAKDIKRQREEAIAAREALKPKPLAEVFPIPATPETLTTEQRQIKLALDNVIRDMHARGASGTLTSADLDALRQQLAQLQAARDDATAPFFDAIQNFLDSRTGAAQ